MAAALCLSVAVTACGDDDPAGPGGDTGQAEAVITDDPSSASPSLGAARANLAAAGPFTGQASGDFMTEISVDGAVWVPLGSPNGITVDLQSTGSETTVHGQQSVPVGTYTRVRLVMQNVSADLAAGSVIGGVTIGAGVAVSVESGNQVVVEKTVQPFTISADATARIVFDLNSEAWIDQESVNSGTASEAEVQSSVAAAASVATS